MSPKLTQQKFCLFNYPVLIAPVIIISFNMAGLLKYFRRESKQKLPVLPDLKGSLSEKVQYRSFITSLLHACTRKETRHKYSKFTFRVCVDHVSRSV